MGLSIRWRLTLWNTLALAVVLACFAALVYGLLRRALFEQTDRLLLAAADQLRNDPRAAADPAGRLDYWVHEFKDHQNLFCAVYRPDGTLHRWTPGLARDHFPSSPPATAESLVDTLSLPGLGRQRLLAEPMRLGGEEYVVVLLAPLGAVDQELDQVRAVLLTAGPLALLLAAGFAFWLARKALAPVEQLRLATDAVTAERLDRRLPVLNPDDEFGRLTHTINGMIARLERSFTEVRRFTADASHELRTPLAVLRGEAEVALEKDLSADECRHLLRNFLEELGRMSRLTDQLLALSRRDAGVEPFTPVPVDLRALAAGVVEAFGPLAAARGVGLKLDAEGPIVVPGDEPRLRQVCLNLLDNALKYTPEGGRVTVRVGGQGEWASLSVEDTGIGIPAEHLPRVFDRFYRVDRARSRAEGGTGLGLSIARSIVAGHGGAIEITSTEGRGTTCTVRLPRPPLGD